MYYAKFYFRVSNLEGTHFPLTLIKKKKAKDEIATGTTCPRNGVWLYYCEAALFAAVAVSR